MSLPDAFLNRLKQIYGAAMSREMSGTFRERPTTFRVNTLKADVNEVLDQLAREGFKIKRVPWFGLAFVLMSKSKRELSKLKLYSDGKIYLQSLASQAPVVVLDPKPNETVLDMTAAPGSKTGQIAAAMQMRGLLIAWEKDKVRYEKLCHNMELMGVKRDFLQLQCGDALSLSKNDDFSNRFDRILLDAPCSAEARFDARDKRSFAYWSEDKVIANAKLQTQLILQAWQMLKPGGTLVYSTCTFAPEENEQVLEQLLRGEKSTVEILAAGLAQLRAAPGVREWAGQRISFDPSKVTRIIPTAEIEGFFIAKLKKRSAN